MLFLTSLYSFDSPAKETKLLSSDKKRRSIYSYMNHQRDSEVATPKKNKKPPMVNESIASGSGRQIKRKPP